MSHFFSKVSDFIRKFSIVHEFVYNKYLEIVIYNLKLKESMKNMFQN